MAVVVREPGPDDFEAYITLGVEFFRASPVADTISLDVSGIATFLANALGQDHIGVWLAEKDGEIVGIAGAMIYPLYFSPQHSIAQELWWWLTPKARGSGAGKAMFDRIETWAKDKGADAVFALSLANQKPEAMAKIYKRLGYRPLEQTYIKGL